MNKKYKLSFSCKKNNNHKSNDFSKIKMRKSVLVHGSNFRVDFNFSITHRLELGAFWVVLKNGGRVYEQDHRQY